MSFTKYCHHHLSVHIQDMDISETSSTHTTTRTKDFSLSPLPSYKNPCRRTTSQLSWLPVANLVGNFPTNHPWWEVSAPKNWKPFTGITQFQRKHWEKHKMEKPFRLGMWEVPIPRSPLPWGDSRTSKAQEQQQSSFSGSSSSQRILLTPSGNVQFLLFPPRATINKLKALWHLICCLHLKLHLEMEQHKAELLPKAAPGATFLLLIKVIIFHVKHCSEPSRCGVWTETHNYPCNNSQLGRYFF